MRHRTVVTGIDPLSIEDVVALARGEASIALPTDREWHRRVEQGCAELEQRLARGEVVYGVNTGYGGSCGRAVPADLVRALPVNLVRYHGCGLGRDFDPEASGAILAARIASLARGYSGTRLVLLERLCALLNLRVLPAIPEEGSVGASGDLTPLSYVAALVVGEREVLQRGHRVPAADALRAAGLAPLELAPKEALAIMNGTAVMTGVACLAFERSERLVRLASRITALGVLALRGNHGHFHERLFELKPHAGQARVAAAIRAALASGAVMGGAGVAGSAAVAAGARVQDPYSLRCAPHVLGVLADALDWIRGWIETELNSVNDNPLIDSDLHLVLHGGNFYGGHIAFAMDALKIAVASSADLLDRQLALLVDESSNRGLPANLSAAPAARLAISHGFKAVQIATSAWAAEAQKLTMPATAFSRSTECHNQDKVSMGTIAARDAVRVLELTEQVAAAGLLASAHGVRLRIERGELDASTLSPELRTLTADVLEYCPLLTEDRALEGALRTTLDRMRAREIA